MELSNRLKAISDYVEQDAKLADIGTDHGYIPIYLAKTGRIKMALACDVNRGPLEKAKMNIKQLKVEDYVKTRLSDGLAKLDQGEVDTVLIAGMGGLLIEKIMERGKEVLGTVKHLILSPHSDVEQVRRKIHKLGFRIRHEQLMKDEGKCYSILDAVKGQDKKYDTKDYKYGKILIEEKSTILKELLQKKAAKYEEIIHKLIKEETVGTLARSEEMKDELKEIREVLACL